MTAVITNIFFVQKGAGSRYLGKRGETGLAVCNCNDFQGNWFAVGEGLKHCNL